MYIDAFLDKKADIIRVAERVNGQRILRQLPPPYVFYFEDSNGTHESIYGHACRKVTTNNGRKFYSMLRDRRAESRRIFESDINPVFRALADQYAGADTPDLNLGFVDIETGFDPKRGFAPPDDPFNPVTAVTIFRSADQQLLTFVLRPPAVSSDAAQAIVAKLDDCTLFDDECDLLRAMLDAIQDVDVISGWNSSAFDLPYLVNRVRKLIDTDSTRQFCLWDQLPATREYVNKFGRTINSYDLVGRVHLDYLDLYAKHNQQQRLSYALNAIGEAEVGETKVPYEGTLDDLYNNDFEKFIVYNRQDVLLMVKIDQKLGYIELANQIAHANCVLFKTTMGSVALIEQAIINEVHALGKIVPDRPERDSDDAPRHRLPSGLAEPEDVADAFADPDDEEDERSPVVGAYVAQPKVGLHEHIGAVDINSLYPSAIRALNMSPETLVAQVRSDKTTALIEERVKKLSKTQRADAWEGIFCALEVQQMLDRTDDMLTVDFCDHLNGTVTTQQMTAAQLYDLVFDDSNHLCISANGTIFRTDVVGIIPALLAKWYAQRKDYQKRARELGEQASVTDDAGEKTRLQSQVVRYNFLQLSVKLRLNSLYGTLLNAAFRLADPRLGQSTTLSGRMIDRHMNAKLNEVITGVYDHTGDALIYADTDSGIFSAYALLKDQPDYRNFEWTRENVIQLYDLIAEDVNASFPAFMDRTFHTGLERGAIIRAGRELVASRGLFIKKKKYAMMIYDLEGNRQDINGKPGKLKAMGLDLKRSDTPRVMQQFLEKLLTDLLTDIPHEEMFENIRRFRQEFKARPGWEKGAPKKVANLQQFAARLADANNKGVSLRRTRKDEKTKVEVPWHVLASLNWNRLCEVFDDRFATRIADSGRVIVCKLRNNPMGMTSIAYPIDETHLPEWFRELPFDHDAMEEAIIDKKILNLVGVLNWDLTDTKANVARGVITWD